MRLLDITIDAGPDAAPAKIEAFVRGVRVAVDVAREAGLRRIRRDAAEQMRFPTDSELAAAIERLPAGDERSPRYRAERQLKARQWLRDEVFRGPPELWLDWFYRRGRKFDVGLRDGLRSPCDLSAPSPVDLTSDCAASIRGGSGPLASLVATTHRCRRASEEVDSPRRIASARSLLVAFMTGGPPQDRRRYARDRWSQWRRSPGTRGNLSN